MTVHRFEGKTKEDLIEIVRVSGVLPIGKARAMRKADLITILENADQNQLLAGISMKDAPPQRKRGRPHKHLLPTEGNAVTITATPADQLEPALHSNEDLTPNEVTLSPTTDCSNKALSTPSTSSTENQSTESSSTDLESSSQETPSSTKPRRRKQPVIENTMLLVELSSEENEDFSTPHSFSVNTPQTNRSQAQENRPSEALSKRMLPSVDEGNTTQEETVSPTPDLHRSYRSERHERKDRPERFDRRKRFERSHFSSTKSTESSIDLSSSSSSSSDDDQTLISTSSPSEERLENATDFREQQEGRENRENRESRENRENRENRDDSITGILEILPDGYGFIRSENYLPGSHDAYVPPQFIRRFGLRAGDLITGLTRSQRDRDNDRGNAIFYITAINEQPMNRYLRRPRFDRLTPIYPNERLCLETDARELSTRIIDLMAPIGKGQRGMIVSPPKAGKTVLLQKIANAITANNPQARLIVLLIDERPEEVTDMQRSIQGEVAYSTFDKTPENHVKLAELVLERAMRLVELGEDVIILLDSITRLARAYNLTINPTGRTLSGGLDPGALYGPKRFFGAARNIENGGSLTIVATALVDTGSRMDEVIFEEFKGTGNMEVYLDRKLSEKRIFPAIDINRSGTRREDLLLSPKELDAVWAIRKALGQMDSSNVTEMMINLLLKTTSNDQFVSSVNISFNDKALFESMRGRNGNSQPG